MIRLTDLQEAERHLDEALTELRHYNSNPEEWRGTWEEVKDRKRQLVVSEAHFHQLSDLQAKVDAASRRLTWARQAFFGGGVV